MEKRLGCFISEEEKQLLDRLTKKLNKSQGELIGELIRSYENLSNRDSVLSLEAFNLSVSEQREVENALTNSNSSLEEMVKDGLIQRSRYLNSVAERQAKLESMSDSELGKATFKGVANYRIGQVVEMIINHNDAQPEKSRKVCITKGIVFKLTGSNRQTINKYFDEYEVRISDHNLKHSLTDTDNRKGKGFSFEQLLGVA